MASGKLSDSLEPEPHPGLRSGFWDFWLIKVSYGKTHERMTTIILASTFAMYMFSPVNNMFRIGLLASMGLIAALIADFTMTPIVILVSKPFGKEKSAVELQPAAIGAKG